jgi:hypothetical protein
MSMSITSIDLMSVRFLFFFSLSCALSESSHSLCSARYRQLLQRWYLCFLQQLPQVRTMSGCGHIHPCAYWHHFIAQESGFREATADRVVRDLSGGRAASPFAPDGACRARHTSNHPHQSISRHSGSRAHCISTFSVVESSSLLLREGRRALLAAIFMWHLQCTLDALPLGSQVPPTGVNTQSVPVVSDKIQRPTSYRYPCCLA